MNQPRQQGGGLLGSSFSIGTVWGVDVQVHSFFVLWILFCVLQEPNDIPGVIEWNLLLFGSVFLHEMGHCFGARKVGGVANRVILYPLGGLAMLRTPATAWAEFISTAAGTAVNFLLCFVGLGLAIAGGMLGMVDGSSFLDALQSGPVLVRIGLLVLTINLFLFVFNVIPAFPMDGGRIFRSMLWPLFGWRTATLIATVLGMGFGGLFAFLGLIVWGQIFLAFIGAWIAYVSYGEFQRAQSMRPPPKAFRPTDDKMPFER